MISKKYCEIYGGICPFNFLELAEKDSIFSAYSNQDENISQQVNEAIDTLNKKTDVKWLKWDQDLDTENDLIFCTICKKIICSKAILVELSDLNFNVIFEYGYSIGLNKKI